VREIRVEPELKRFVAIPGHGAGQIRNIDAYIHGIISIQGQGGSNAMMTVSYRLIDAGHTFDEALAKLRTWNESCAFPPWPDKELIRGLTNAFKRKAAEPMEGHPQSPLQSGRFQTSEGG
jgi:hypothetical protein